MTITTMDSKLFGCYLSAGVMWVKLETSWGWCVPLTPIFTFVGEKVCFSRVKIWLLGWSGLPTEATTRGCCWPCLDERKILCTVSWACSVGNWRWMSLSFVLFGDGNMTLWRCWCSAEYCCNASSPSGLNKRRNLHSLPEEILLIKM